MKYKLQKTIFLILLMLTGTVYFSSCVEEILDIAIIPKPQSIELKEGQFTINPQTRILYNEGGMETVNYLQKQLKTDVDISLEVKESNDPKETDNCILILTAPELKNHLGEEGYTLQIDKSGIKISAATSTGNFYGIQSLRQLLPVQKEENAEYPPTIPCLLIEDKPRFSWRAFMLDEARHFKGMKVVKKLLDQMVLHKMNVFHWHLADDQGWRIEIKKFPDLTEIGSKRADTQIGGWDSDQYSGQSHEGFYTQDQIREIVQYATDRHINIVPEIEMPGHASAAIASYPWLGASGNKIEVSVRFGKHFDIFNVADPEVEQFLRDVLLEVTDLFPSKVIHIGGDEVKYDQWKESKQIQIYMKEEGLKTPADLQIHFTNKISNFIESQGRRMMGWNEILGGHVLHAYQSVEDTKVSQKLAQNAIIHFWKGDLKLAEDAILRGYDIVNSYHVFTYLDYTYEDIPLKKAYNFDPIPEGLDSTLHAKVLGLGCQMWGEWIPTVESMEYQVYPRLSAYAEVGWTDNDMKDFNDFSYRLETMKNRWDNLGIQFARLELVYQTD